MNLASNQSHQPLLARGVVAVITILGLGILTGSIAAPLNAQNGPPVPMPAPTPSPPTQPKVGAFYALASPNQGVVGALVIVTGKEWPINDSVDISWPNTNWPNTNLVQTVPTDGNGSFAVTIAAPKAPL